MIKIINPTSKTALKNQCLYLAQGDLHKAQEFYNFYIEGLEDIPATDPVQPTWQENTKDTVNGIMGWLKENQGTLITGVDYIRGLFGRLPIGTTGEVVETAEELEEIN